MEPLIERYDEVQSSELVLDQLLGPNLIRIALQGVHRLSDGSTIGAEALMRGPKGVPYESPPLAFALAANLDMLERLDCHCIEKAARSSVDGTLFINVHPRTLAKGSPFWKLLDRFGSDGLRDPRATVFEIVEHSPARQSDLPTALLELRARGFGIAVDDFGEGAAGLRRLVEVAPEYAKIDHFFVRQIDTDRRKQSVVRAIVSICADMGSKVIAEGVEHEPEANVLTELGVELAQGWYFSRPVEIALATTKGTETHG